MSTVASTVSLASAILCPLLAGASDRIIAQYNGVVLEGGKSGYFAEVQNKLNQLRTACGLIPSLSTNGQFGPGMRDAIMKAASCPAMQSSLPLDSEARRGAITEALWAILFPRRAKPSVHERAMVLVITQEATDYDHAEWNFCQSHPTYLPPKQPICYSSDPHSFLTWGPRGATAGNGAEVQQILHAIDSDPRTTAIIDQAFGSIAAPVRRLVRLNAGDTERFLCNTWHDPQLRQGWKDGFARFGASKAVDDVYDEVYASSSYDGGKIAQYCKLYKEASIERTEVDYAFMVDRATQMGAPGANMIAAAQTFVKSRDNRVAPAELRRWLALNFRPSNQSTDRLGRDVVFYIDALEASLTPQEKAAWKRRNPMRSSDAGLSDVVQLPEFRAPGLAYPLPPRGTDFLTDAERKACPAAVLKPQLPSAAVR